LVPLVGHIRDMIRLGGDDVPIARELNMSSEEVTRFWAVGRVYVKGMHALAHREREGVWGGATERERRRIVRHRRKSA